MNDDKLLPALIIFFPIEGETCLIVGREGSTRLLGFMGAHLTLYTRRIDDSASALSRGLAPLNVQLLNLHTCRQYSISHVTPENAKQMSTWDPR